MASHRTSDIPEVLAAADLTLAVTSGRLTGPAGSAELGGYPLVVLRETMLNLGREVTVDHMIAALWPDVHREPRNPEAALRQAATRARDALQAVGVDRNRLDCRYRGGFVLTGEAVFVRLLRPAQAVAWDQLLATHPDRQLAAQVAA